MSGAVIRWPHLLLIATAAVAAGAEAQQSPATVEQLSPPARDLLTSARAPADAAPPAQVSLPADAREAPHQLDAAPRTASAPPQLAPAGRTALPPPALSRRAQGRDVATDRLHGPDRCDPARPSADATRCAHVIENRAAEFAGPRPALSPEQRLLVEQRLLERPRTLDKEMRRLVRNEGDPDSSDAQAIAAAALANQGASIAPAKDDDPAATAADAAVVEAIIAGGNGPTVLSPPR